MLSLPFIVLALRSLLSDPPETRYSMFGTREQLPRSLLHRPDDEYRCKQHRKVAHGRWKDEHCYYSTEDSCHDNYPTPNLT